MTFLQDNNENQGLSTDKVEDGKKKNSSVFSKLCNFQSIISILLMVIVFITPFLVYLSVFNNIEQKELQNKCLIDKIYRLPCGKENMSSTDCSNIFCCFEVYTNSCYHSIPSDYYYSSIDSIPNLNKTPLGLDSLKYLNINIIDDYPRLRIILNDEQHLGRNLKSDSQFNITENESNKISVSVFRQTTNEMLLTTAKGPLIASEEYLEWSLQLTTNRGVLFGLGQLKIDLDENSTLTKIIYKNKDDSNTLPNFMAYNNGKYHAVIIKHDGALQITVLPSYLIFLRSIGGKKIEILLIDGPTPKDIYKHLTVEKVSIPEWGLGVHLCRENQVKDLDAVMEQYNSFSKKKSDYSTFDYETDCIHDDLLLHLLSENRNTEYVTELFKNLNMKEKFLLSFPPQIPIKSKLFEQYKTTTLFYKDETTGSFYQGKYKNFDVVYPNYEHTGITMFLNDIFQLFEGITNLEGYTYTNSWPQDDGYHLKGKPSKPFIDQSIQAALSYTLPWNLKDGNEVHLRHHNEYGSKVQEKVNDLQKNDFSFSSVSSANTYGPLIIQNMNTSWTDLKISLVTSLYNSLFGHSLISIPVCGSNDFYDIEFNEDLCLRWYIMAATMPLVRISSSGRSRDPISLNTKYTNQKVIEILKKRQSLMPFYRTLLEQGEPLSRPMFFEFPNNETLHDLDEQYMVGESLLVAQPMTANIEIMKIYLPPNIVWYEFWGGLKYFTEKGSEWINFPIFKSDWISFVIEGAIIPTVTYSENKYSNINLIVALNCTKTCQATGSLLSEPDDIQVKFSALGEKITIDAKDEKKIDEIKKLITNICFYNYTLSRCENNDVQKYIV